MIISSLALDLSDPSALPFKLYVLVSRVGGFVLAISVIGTYKYCILNNIICVIIYIYIYI